MVTQKTKLDKPEEGMGSCPPPRPLPPLVTKPGTFPRAEQAFSAFQAGKAPNFKAPSSCRKEELIDG